MASNQEDKILVAECPVCDEIHEWFIDDGIGAAFDQGWVDCPEYGHVAVSEENAELLEDSELIQE
jgi:hypothetical protein